MPNKQITIIRCTKCGGAIITDYGIKGEKERNAFKLRHDHRKEVKN